MFYKVHLLVEAKVCDIFSCTSFSPLIVLVTGGASFIGFHASLRLSEKGHEVVLLDNFNNDDAILRKKASILSEKGNSYLHAYDE